MIGRKFRSGYTDFGSRYNSPQFGTPVIMKDRATGVSYLVSWNTTIQPTIDTFGHISITDVIANQYKEAPHVFESDDGPQFSGIAGTYTLFIRTGHLGIDYTPFPIGEQSRNDQLIFAIKKGTSTLRQLYLKESAASRAAWTPDGFVT